MHSTIRMLLLCWGMLLLCNTAHIDAIQSDIGEGDRMLHLRGLSSASATSKISIDGHTGARQSRGQKNAACSLSDDQKAKYYKADIKAWEVDDAALKDLGSDLQLIVDCATGGDSVILSVTDDIYPAKKIHITKALTFTAAGTTSNEVTIAEVDLKPVFTCPDLDEGIFEIESAGVVLANLIIRDCELSDDSPVVIGACPSGSTSSPVSFYHVEFEGLSRDNGPAAIQTLEPSCSAITLENVKFTDNSCKKAVNGLVEAIANVEITASHITAIGNKCTVFKLTSSAITLSDSTFDNNKGVFDGNTNIALGASLRFESTAKGTVTGTSFQRGRAKNGGDIYMSGESEVVGDNLQFTKSYGFRTGGAFHVVKSSLTLKNSHFVECGAKETGGAVHVSQGHLTGEQLSFVRSEALQGGGAIELTGSEATLTDVDFKENTALSGEGGALRAETQSTVTAETLSFSENKANNGGCISLRDSSMTLTDTVTTHNVASEFGGVFHLSNSTLEGMSLTGEANEAKSGGLLSLHDESSATVSNSKMHKQKVSLDGGAALLSSKSTLIGEDLDITDNTAYNGGGIYVGEASSLDLKASKLSGNSVREVGGGIVFNNVEASHVEDVILEANEGGTGGGIYCKSSAVDVVKSTFTKNLATTSGGGIALEEKSTMTGTTLTFQENEGEGGGGLSLSSESEITLEGSTFEKNFAGSRGGAWNSAGSTMKGKGLTVTLNSASQGAGCSLFGGTVELEEVVFTNNNASTDGGAVYGDMVTFTGTTLTFEQNAARHGAGMMIEESLSVVLKGCSFLRNTAVSLGGALRLKSSNVQCEKMTIVGNSAIMGGAVHSQGGDVEFTDIEVTDNVASRSNGGGIYFVGDKLTATRMTVERNSAGKNGGGLYVYRCDLLQISDSVIDGNKAKADGGGIYGGAKHVTASNVQIRKNNGARAGGFYTTSAEVHLTNVSLVENTATRDGGAFLGSAIQLEASELTVQHSSAASGAGLHLTQGSSIQLTDATFKNNIATGLGGALFSESNKKISAEDVHVEQHSATNGAGFYITKAEQIQLSSCTFSENTVTEDGGAIYVADGGTMQLSSCTVSKNKAEKSGGGLYVRGGKDLLLTSTCTVSGNEAVYRGGGLYVEGVPDIALLTCALSENKAGEKGGSLFAQNGETATVEDSKFEDGTAESGAGMYLDDMACSLSGTDFNRNKAWKYGGAMAVMTSPKVTASSLKLEGNAASFGGACFFEGSTAVLSQCTFKDNSAENKGGAINSIMSSVLTVHDLRFEGNNATAGGAIYASKNTIAVTDTAFVSNKASYGGGAMVVTEESVFDAKKLTFEANEATEGGAMKIEYESNTTLEDTTLSGNKAIEAGGALHVSFTYHQVWKHLTIEHNSAGIHGGGAYLKDVFHGKLINVQFEQNKAPDGGGLIVAPVSYIEFEDTHFQRNEASGDGGGVHLIGSQLSGEKASFGHNVAGKGGGLFMIGYQSSLKCKDFTFEANRATERGGALFVDSTNGTTECQVQDSAFIKNHAKFGGALHLARSEKQAKECVGSFEGACQGIEIWNTKITDNTAEDSGAIALVSDAYGLRYSCEKQETKTEMKTLEPVVKSHSAKDATCPNWSQNTVPDQERVVQEFGTYPRDIDVAVISDTAVHRPLQNGNEDIHLDTMTGLILPPLDLSVRDSFWNLLQPASGGFFQAKLVAPKGFFERGTEMGYHMVDNDMTFSGIACDMDPGVYNLELHYQNSVASGVVPVTVNVTGCPVGMTMGIDRECHECGPGQFSREGKCIQCPQGTTCYKHFILPSKGRWHKNPCRSETQRCLSEDGCRFETRLDDLKEFDRSLDSCNLTEEQLEAYAAVQCEEGYGSALCGSCEGNYGPLSKWRCAKCLSVPWSVVLFLAMIVWVSLLAYIQITRHAPMRPDSTPLTESLKPLPHDLGEYPPEAEEAPPAGRQPTVAHVPSSSGAAITLHDDMDINRSAELIKILMNYLQLSAVLASLNVRWMSGVKRVLEVAECVSGVTTLITSFISDCLLSRWWSLSRPVLRFITGLCTPFIISALIIGVWSLSNAIFRRSFSSFARFVKLTLFVVFYIAYLGITNLTIKMFYCVSVHDSTDLTSDHRTKVLADDTSVECYGETHWTLLGIAILVVVLFCVGFPLFSFIRIRRRVLRGSVSDLNVGNTMGFMYWPFQMDYFYWESIVFLRKAVLATICVFSRSMGENQQQVYAAVILFFFLYLQVTRSPYGHEFKSYNFYESTSLLLSTVTLSFGMVFGDEAPMENTRVVVTSLLTVLNVAFVLSFLIPAIQITRDMRSRC